MRSIMFRQFSKTNIYKNVLYLVTLILLSILIV